MTALPTNLHNALDRALNSASPGQLAQSVDTLISQYRSGSPPTAPILRSTTDVAAYAAYRMPATYAAVHTALRHFAELNEGFAPTTHVDIGGGTGAVLWAAREIWPSLTSSEIFEQALPAIDFGKKLLSFSADFSTHSTKWTPYTIGSSMALPAADLITLSYVLGELPPNRRGEIVTEMAKKGETVAILEPGTPAGYERILSARTQLLDAGMQISAPCPHSDPCPIVSGKDWCHFSARINRSSLHRQIKSASLAHEDEKFSYVIATRNGTHAENRIVRHPLLRKGIVSLKLCKSSGELVTEVVSKRQGQTYKDARDSHWGEPWPAPDRE